MFRTMNFSRWVFRIAGIYGILIIIPMFFSEARMNQQFPPDITHPEYYYGFAGVTLAWQVAFLVISMDPQRYRMLIIPCIIEKWAYVVELFVLYLQDRITAFQLGFSGIDFSLGALFLTVFMVTGRNHLVRAGVSAPPR